MRYPSFLCELAEALCGEGRPQEALIAVERALDMSRRNEELWCIPELLRVKGEIARAGGAQTQAEACFIESLDWARRQKALSWELRAATSHARLRREQRAAKEGYDLLLPVYGRFTEGFQTRDLRVAKHLLEELTGAATPPTRMRRPDARR
jgi:predicted ATPase